MSLDRKTVERTAGLHIRQLQQFRSVSEKEKTDIRRVHERAAMKVQRKAENHE